MRALGSESCQALFQNLIRWWALAVAGDRGRRLRNPKGVRRFKKQFPGARELASLCKSTYPCVDEPIEEETGEGGQPGGGDALEKHFLALGTSLPCVNQPILV